MPNESYTLIIVPERHSRVRRLRFQSAWALYAAVLLVLCAGAAAGLGWHYVRLLGLSHEAPGLRDDNLRLRGEVAVIREQLEHVHSTIERVERFDQKLRAMAMLSDPQRSLAMGPTAEPGAQARSERTQFVRPKEGESPRVLGARLDQLSAEATRQEQSLAELQAYFEDQRSLLGSVPSIWPVRGWVTSDFGSRVDPYTSERVMHAGLDISGPHGKEVIAPSDGTVVFAAVEGGYGNVLVVDHGYGVKTRYAHLATITVKPGERVRRGQLMARLGNTGRSTGPHLHYEVRVNGIAQNPRKFILDDF